MKTYINKKMKCDRCHKQTNHIYINEDHEKVCERDCKGVVNIKIERR